MEELFVTKKCACCGSENVVYSQEYINELSKQGYESAGYIAVAKFTYINIESCKNCGYCNNDISKLTNHNILHSEKYKSLQNYSKFEENSDNYYHTLLIGAYVLEENKDYLNSARAYMQVRKNLGDISFQLAKEALSEEQLKKYQPVFDYYQKIKDYCLDKSINLSQQEFTINKNQDALLMLLYLLKEAESYEECEKLQNILETQNLTQEQNVIFETIKSIQY